MDMMKSSWLLTHPKLLELESYGLGNSSQQQATLLTYLELTEVRLWREVKFHVCPALKIFYLSTREKEESVARVVVPVPSTEPLSMEHLARLHSATRETTEEVEDGLTLALVERDSSIVYCRMWPNIHLPSPPADTT